MSTDNPGRIAERRYLVRTLAAMAVFALAMLGLDRLLPEPEGGAALAVTLAIIAPLMFWAYEYQHFIRHIDEMLARLQLQGAAIAGGLALLLAAFWGVAETNGLLPDLNPALFLPVATAAHGVIMLIQRARMG